MSTQRLFVSRCPYGLDLLIIDHKGPNRLLLKPDEHKLLVLDGLKTIIQIKRTMMNGACPRIINKLGVIFDGDKKRLARYLPIIQ